MLTGAESCNGAWGQVPEDSGLEVGAEISSGRGHCAAPPSGLGLHLTSLVPRKASAGASGREESPSCRSQGGGPDDGDSPLKAESGGLSQSGRRRLRPPTEDDPPGYPAMQGSEAAGRPGTQAAGSPEAADFAGGMPLVPQDCTGIVRPSIGCARRRLPADLRRLIGTIRAAVLKGHSTASVRPSRQPFSVGRQGMRPVPQVPCRDPCSGGILG